MDGLETNWALAYYFMSIAWKVHSLAFIAAIASVASAVGSGFIFLTADSERERNIAKKAFGYIIPIAVVSFFALIIFPSKNDIKMMVAITGVETAVKNDKVKSIAAKSVSTIEKVLDEIENGR